MLFRFLKIKYLTLFNKKYREAKEENRYEVLYTLKNILKEYEAGSGTGVYCLPNGNVWEYKDIARYLENNLR